MGVYRSTPLKDKDTHLGEAHGRQWVTCGMQGWRQEMEDAEISQEINEEVSVYGVFDGHGGKEVSYFVKQHFVDELKQNESFKKKNYPQALEETFKRMDELLDTIEGLKELNNIKSNGQTTNSEEPSEAGCTACVALVTKTEIYVANAGDSRCYVSQNKKAVALSFDHKPDNEIVKAGGTVKNGRVNENLNLSRAMGDMEYKRNKQLRYDEQLIICKPDIKVHKIDDNIDFMILGCDGVWEIWDAQKIIEFCETNNSQKLPIQQTAESLLDNILGKSSADQYGLDNMTFIMVLFKKN